MGRSDFRAPGPEKKRFRIRGLLHRSTHGSVAAALVGVLLEEDLVDEEDAAEDAGLGVGLRVAGELDLEGVRVGE